MRKGPGLSALSRQSAYSNSYSTLSTSISTQQIASLTESLESFKSTLIEFSLKHKKDIKDDPAFRFQFQKMCSTLGIDPLVGSTSAKGSGSGGLWGMLGISEFEYELAVQLVDICVSTREKNGGLIRVDELIRKIERLRHGGKTMEGEGGITEQDIIRAIKILEPLKSGYKLHTFSSDRYVRSIPNELNTDQSILLSLAATTGGRLNLREIEVQTGWNDDRIDLGLRDCVMEQGLGWVDEQCSTEGGRGEEIRGDVWIIAVTGFDE
ncbi:hypothetical protein I204_07030 [Kwoniella mangroviensis CBS 8886]|uniref:uncharacterized protein n=1 Tax=Kwoniella mangroviensis CBS 8507 TaxID=1296122 RepID=UPI00080D4EE0|nr:uncharacterized protein I203_00997 [Kwoniella mangroviensis CBS 8507]OCF69144.1 hypothetical protein I203_00997 [Kwoniella mangroviensis CBS 8507]OCF72647.1 hypothetical protein I204_07030 [Kwoniella mangroviensis CBS 8886]